MAKELGGDRVETFSATTGLQDPHHIEARPNLIAKIRNADLVACTGADLESGWLPLLLKRSGNNKIQKGNLGHFMASEHVRLLGIPKQIDRGQGDIHAAGNPHIHTNPKNILRIAKSMSGTLEALDPDNAAFFKENLSNFVARWETALGRWEEKVKPLMGVPVVVYHDSWIYLEDWLKLKQVAVLEEKPGIPPSSGHLAQIITQMKSEPASMIIYAAYQNDKAALWLSNRTNIPIVKLPFTIGGTSDSNDLFSLYESSINLLLKAVPH